jgi:hypothetical protein
VGTSSALVCACTLLDASVLSLCPSLWVLSPDCLARFFVAAELAVVALPPQTLRELVWDTLRHALRGTFVVGASDFIPCEPGGVTGIAADCTLAILALPSPVPGLHDLAPFGWFAASWEPGRGFKAARGAGPKQALALFSHPFIALPAGDTFDLSDVGRLSDGLAQAFESPPPHEFCRLVLH